MIYGNYLRDKYNNAAVKLADAKGYPCEFDNSKGRPLKDYKLYGNSVQNGTPTPDNPVEVQSVGEKTRNIWYPSVDALKSNGITCTRNNDNTYTVNGTATADFYFHIGKITIEVGTTYYLSGGTSQAPIAFQLREGSTGVTTLYNHGGITTFSPTGEHSIDIINCVIAVRSGVEVNNVIVKPMISLENTDEYEPYGYKIPIKVCGKNLINESSITLSNGYWSDSVGNPINNSDYIRMSPVKCNPNTKYTLSSNLKIHTIWFFNNDTYISKTYRASTVAIIKTPENCNRLRISFYNTSGNANTVAFQWIQLELGGHATTYEPYIGETTHIYLDAPLRKVGSYADYIDFKNQKVVRNIVKHSLSVDSIYRKLNNVIRLGGMYWDIHQKGDYNMYSTIFRNVPESWHNEIESIFHHNDAYYIYYWSVYWHRLGLTYDGTNVYRTDDTEQTPLTDSEIINIAKQWLNTLSDKDKEIYMIRSKSTEKSTTLPALKTFKGTNIISVDTNISPSNIQVQYIEK